MPLTGRPSEVMPRLRQRVSGYIANQKVKEFYIGRTNDAVATKSRHGAQEVVSLYETESVDNAIVVEDSLIKSFYEHAKCSNDNDHSGGGASDGWTNYVYLALWYRR
jgi:hypothetical protein